jgi:hypothetical protein
VSHRRRERSQTMTEFALVIPVLLLMIFGILDLGRLFYAYATISNAANEGARTAAHTSLPGQIAMPDNTEVLAAVRSRSAGVPLSFGACPNGPVTSSGVPDGAARVFITAPAGEAMNAPGGQPASSAGGCSAVVPASGHVPLRVTIVHRFQPATPLLHDWGVLTITASATYQTEY